MLTNALVIKHLRKHSYYVSGRTLLLLKSACILPHWFTVEYCTNRKSICIILKINFLRAQGLEGLYHKIRWHYYKIFLHFVNNEEFGDSYIKAVKIQPILEKLVERFKLLCESIYPLMSPFSCGRDALAGNNAFLKRDQVSDWKHLSCQKDLPAMFGTLFFAQVVKLCSMKTFIPITMQPRYYSHWWRIYCTKDTVYRLITGTHQLKFVMFWIIILLMSSALYETAKVYLKRLWKRNWSKVRQLFNMNIIWILQSRIGRIRVMSLWLQLAFQILKL